MPSAYTAPGLEEADAAKVRDALQDRLLALIDLTLTLKHIHWNVVGPNFIGVHEMLDPQYAGVSEMVDAVAEQVDALDSIKNNIARECLRLLSVDPPIYISTVSDVPASSGLGSSSSFAVGLLNALTARLADGADTFRVAVQFVDAAQHGRLVTVSHDMRVGGEQVE